ncbi:hypothetical protein PaG_01751 [Moesziomyces aphidis]|uniref:Uncharacterized protein n=2 Tax=Moesziomyces TaxID=63261 RepID=M9LV33_PSEA3|nr:hypothetical protein PaG_01751 [Moesziomyces aphidis]GAC73444.1 hypothetical protein PANT_9d00106 [Moesziomyces antarcticus T-34]
MYSTSPSSSSMASSSGRSSPEQSAPQPASQPQRSNSFLLPQFFFGSSANQTSSSNTDTTPHPATNALLSQPPRRTSFGAGFSNGGRLSALSAFGFMSSPSSAFPSSALSSSPPPSLAGAAALSRQSGSAIESPTSELAPSAPPANKPAPAKRHHCFPDGMGGTMCVEVKDRNRRGSSIN